jgi:hypothetical protein
MTELDKERAKLVNADLAVVEGELRLTDQMALIQKLRRKGEDTILAEAVLTALSNRIERVAGAP